MSSAVKNSGMAISAHRYKIFGKALERVQHDNQVTVRLGSPITGYGQETRNRAARQRISHRTFTDEDGIERVEVRYVHFFLSAEAYFLLVCVVCDKKKYLF
jgi:hypothetical protein